MRLFFLLPLVLLAACQASGTPRPAADPVHDSCGAGSRQYLVGTDASALDAAALPQGTRVIHPNTAVTMDHRPDRLNVHVSDEGRITRVVCG